MTEITTQQPKSKQISSAKVMVILLTCLALGVGAPIFYDKFEQQIKLAVIAGLICH